MQDISNILDNSFVRQKIAYAESINLRINGRKDFINLTINEYTEYYVLICKDDLFDLELCISKETLLSPKNRDKFIVEYSSICPFTSNEYTSKTTAEYTEGYYWFDDEYGQEQFRTKDNLISINDIH